VADVGTGSGRFGFFTERGRQDGCGDGTDGEKKERMCSSLCFRNILFGEGGEGCSAREKEKRGRDKKGPARLNIPSAPSLFGIKGLGRVWGKTNGGLVYDKSRTRR